MSTHGHGFRLRPYTGRSKLWALLTKREFGTKWELRSQLFDTKEDARESAMRGEKEGTVYEYMIVPVTAKNILAIADSRAAECKPDGDN